MYLNVKRFYNVYKLHKMKRNYTIYGLDTAFLSLTKYCLAVKTAMFIVHIYI